MNVLTISLDGMAAADVARMRRAVELSLRNVEIRTRYRELRARDVEQTEAIAHLAEVYTLGEDSINRIVWPR